MRFESQTTSPRRRRRAAAHPRPRAGALGVAMLAALGLAMLAGAAEASTRSVAYETSEATDATSPVDATLATSADRDTPRGGSGPTAVFQPDGFLLSAGPTVHEFGEIVLFAGAAQAADFFASHGGSEPEPKAGFDYAAKTGDADMAYAMTFLAGGSFLDAAIADAIAESDAVALYATGGDSSAIGATAYSATYGVQTAARGDSGTIATHGGGTPIRFVAASDLPLRTAPQANAGVVREMGAGERVFVLPTLPQTDASANLVFVEVQAADVPPYETGWIPLHWLYDVDPTPSEDTIELRPTYGFMAKQLARGVREAFYGDWCDYPETPHSTWDAIHPQGEPSTVLQAGCGELPMGVATAYGHRRVLDREQTLAGFTDDVVVHTRFPNQRRSQSGYEMLDLRENFFGVPDEVSTIHEYSLFPGHETDDYVRVHDTDLWFNVSAAPPTGIAATGAEAYFNFCFRLPGVVLEVDPFRIDAEIAGIYVGSVAPGAIGVEPMSVCATAAIDEYEPDTDFLTTAPSARPLALTWLHAAVRDVGLYVEEGVTVNGGNGGAISTAVLDWAGDLASALVHVGTNQTPWVFDEYFAESVETALVRVMNDLTAPALDGLPDPEGWVKNSCDRFLGVYDDPSSRYYHLYRHCVDATQPVDIELFAGGGPNPASVCHDPDVYARVNDGRQWSSWSDDQHLFMTESAGSIFMDRPLWATQCGVTSRITTEAADVFWPVMDCLEEELEETLAFDRFGSLTNDAQQACLLPTLAMLCDAYGEGDDLEALWSGGGALPEVSEYLGFCGYYEAVLDAQTEDGPALAIE